MPDERATLSRGHAALAGAAAATVWALAEPLDQRVFRFPYSDVALLGKALTRGRAWRPLGLALHAGNGAVAGLVFREVDRRVGGSRRRNAFAFAMTEHLALYPLTLLTDRFHPARGEPDVPPLSRSARAFAQATFRHALFGVVLGRLTTSRLEFRSRPRRYRSVMGQTSTAPPMRAAGIRPASSRTESWSSLSTR